MKALAILLLPSLAAAEPVLVGVNFPVAWSDSIGASVSAGLTEHQALRGNFARYGSDVHQFTSVLISGGFDDESDPFGKTTDIGVAWVYYPRKVFDGFLLEAGALYRHRDTGMYPYEEDRTTLRSEEVAARFQIGWSWLLWKHASIALAAGISVGREYGTQTDTDTHMSSSVARTDVQAEGMLRFGVAFDL